MSEARHAARGASRAAAPHRLQLLVALLLFAATVLTFLPALHCGFVDFDDVAYVTDNAHVRAGLTRDGVAWAFSDTKVAIWIPLTWLSHMLDAELYGLAPRGHHLTNILLHATNAVVLFLLLVRMTGGFWPSAVAAALFALHPLRVESVAWVAERKDVLSTLFALLTMGAYVAYARAPRPARYATVLACFCLGLMAKPMLVTLPLLLFLLDYWPLGRLTASAEGTRPSTWRLVLEKLPLMALAMAVAAVTLGAAHRTGALAPELSMTARLANAIVSYVRYLGKFVWPVNLAVFYPLPHAWPVWQIAASALILVVISVPLVMARRRHPHLLMGWLWFVVGLLPVIGLVQAGAQGMADRFTYVPTIGLLIAITWAARGLAGASTARNALLTGAVVLVAGTLGTTTSRQIAHWKDSLTLFAHAVAVTDDNWLAHNNLGFALVRAGRPQEGIFHFVEARRIEPTLAEAEFGTGLALHAQGRTDEAIERFELALEIDPTLWKAHNNLGVIMLTRGDIAQALAHLTAAVRREPDSTNAVGNLHRALVTAGYPEEAIESQLQALRTIPARVDANLARPDGAAYDRMLSRWFMANQAGAVQGCVGSLSGEDLAPFELFMTVQADGGASQLLASPPTAVGTCMAARLTGDRLPPPPFAPFHAHMRMNFQGWEAATPAPRPDA